MAQNNSNSDILVYKNTILISILLFIVIYVSYILSKSYRVSKVIHDMNMINSYMLIESKLNLDEYKNAKLCDYYISTAFRPYMGQNQLFEYCDLSILEKIIKNGARSIYVDIFNDNMGLNANPVIGTGLKTGQWKLSLNTIKFEDLCKLLSIICFNPGYVNNYDDPFFLMLNLNTNGNIYCLNKIRDIIYKNFKTYLLSNKYTYSKVNLSQVQMKYLKKKLIIFSSEGFINSKLEEFVNYSWKDDKFKKINYEELIPNEDSDVLKIDGETLKNYNKNNMTLVTPNESTFFTYNYNPEYFFETGCQFVAINYQKIDENLDKYLTHFKTSSFILKDTLLRGSTIIDKVDLSINTPSNNKINMNMDEQKFCPVAPEEDKLEGTDILTFKDDDANNGLCFLIDKDENCNCIKKTPEDSCDDNLFDETFFNHDKNYKLCCSNTRINNIEPIDNSIKHYITSNKLDKQVNVEFTSKSNEYEKVMDSSNMYKLNLAEIKQNQDLQNKRVCLIDKNLKTKKCPNGWDFSVSSTYGYNVCCKKT